MIYIFKTIGRDLLMSISLMIFLVPVIHGQPGPPPPGGPPGKPGKSPSISNVQTLINDVFSPSVYEKSIRGNDNQLEQTVVRSKFLIRYLKSVNERDDSIVIVGGLMIGWNDDRLVWDADQYANITQELRVLNTVWHPEVFLENPSDETAFYGDTARLTVRCENDGSVEMMIDAVFRTYCRLDMSSFPWDTHVCQLRFQIWGYGHDSVIFQPLGDQVLTEKFATNPSWELVNTRSFIQPDMFKSVWCVELTFRRRSTFFVINIIFPMIGIYALSMFVFFIPVENSDRTGYSLTVLLAIAVFLTLVSDKLPPHSENIAAICYLLDTILICSVLTVICAIVSVSYHTKPGTSEEQPPGYLRLLVRVSRKIRYNCRTGCRPCSRKKDSNDVCVMPVHTSTEQHKGHGPANTRFDNEFETISDVYTVADADDVNVTWGDAAWFFDMTCFVLGCTAFLVSSIVFYCYIISTT